MHDSGSCIEVQQVVCQASQVGLTITHQPATNVGWGVQTQSWKSLITMKTIFQASGISKHYGTTCALRDANLVLKAGQIHALMGRTAQENRHSSKSWSAPFARMAGHWCWTGNRWSSVRCVMH